MVGLNGNAFGRTRDLCGSSRDRGAVPRRERRNQIGSRHAIISSWFPEKIFASLFFDQAELFELEVGALDLAFIDGEFLCERGGRRKRLTWSHRLVADVSLNLLAHLQVDGIVRHVLQFNVHGFQSVRVTFESDRGASGSSPFASASSAAKSCPGTM